MQNLLHTGQGLYHQSVMLFLCVWHWGLNSGLCTCLVSTLLLEPLLQSCNTLNIQNKPGMVVTPVIPALRRLRKEDQGFESVFQK
jgi:hypothetical protein